MRRALAGCLMFGTLLCAQTAGLRPAGRIALDGVRGRIDHLAVDEAGRRLFVAALGNRVKSLPGLKEAQGLVYVASRQRLYVACGGDGRVHVFDTAKWSEIASVAVGDDADNVRYDAARHRVWVGHDGGLTQLDEDGQVRAKVALSAHPESFQLAADGSRLFVNIPHSRKLSVVDLNALKVIADWPAHEALSNYALALDSATQRLFTVYRLPARLAAMNSQTGALISKSPTIGDCDDIFYDAVRKRLYVIGGDGGIAIVRDDGAALTETARVAIPRGARTDLFVPGMNRLFVAVRAAEGQGAAILTFDVLP